ncbi:ABC transporter permease [Mobiluncus curtisii]|uniref:Transport permease protein n=1 Tax=Mobiluncus curtisii TaxID=2051 RepID=A0A7Y0UGV2_9ACTO|nr:ABC transporter permease [Mobiluncus curtisii]NMW87063.1 ABC transporter permease [Mobiluncus curtisii]
MAFGGLLSMSSGKTEFNDVRDTNMISRRWNLIRAFGTRDLKARYKGSFLGWAWSLLVPLATLGIYTVVFSVIFRGAPPPMGNGQTIFVLWLFAGLTTWTFFSSSINGGMAALTSSGGMLQKVYFPAYAPVMGAGLAVGVQSLIEIGIYVLVMIVLGNMSWTWLLVPLWMILFIAACQAFAVIVAVLNIYYRDLAHLIAIALQLLFYATPIIYPLSMVNASWKGISLAFIIRLNPLTEYIELYRNLVYSLNPGSLGQWAVCVGTAIVLMLLAWWVLSRKGRDLGERI